MSDLQFGVDCFPAFDPVLWNKKGPAKLDEALPFILGCL